MTSEPIRDPKDDHLLTPENSAFIIIDYQPIQVSSIRSMDHRELIFNIVATAKAAVNYKLTIRAFDGERADRPQQAADPRDPGRARPSADL